MEAKFRAGPLTCRGRADGFGELPRFVAIMNSATNAVKDGVFVYHEVLINRGGGMDKDSGRFTAPIAGLYR